MTVSRGKGVAHHIHRKIGVFLIGTYVYDFSFENMNIIIFPT